MAHEKFSYGVKLCSFLFFGGFFCLFVFLVLFILKLRKPEPGEGLYLVTCRSWLPCKRRKKNTECAFAGKESTFLVGTVRMRPH